MDVVVSKFLFTLFSVVYVVVVFVVSPFPYWQPKINLTFSKFCYRTFALKVFYTNYKYFGNALKNQTQ